MILNKYQPFGDIHNRGYSSTCEVQDATATIYFAKWIKGIQQNSQPSKLFFEKLRLLKRAEHPVLPKIIEYGWDNTQNAYCIIFEFKEAEPLEVIGFDIPVAYFFKGIEQLISCLQLLNTKYRIAHGDITPANILIDKDFNFYLIDFGLADITTTLSQAQHLEVFARQFAAPEKWDRKTIKGFPFQSDIYSLGKVIEWYFEQKDLTEFDELNRLVDLVCHPLPSNRLNYNSFSDEILKIVNQGYFDDENVILIECNDSQLLEELNDKEHVPIFNIWSNTKEEVILVDIATRNYKLHCLWIINEKKLIIKDPQFKEDDKRRYDDTIKHGQKLNLPVVFKESIFREPFDLTPYFRKIQRSKKEYKTHRDQRRHVIGQLDFYKKLLEKELEVLKENSLRLRYVSFEKKGKHEIHFKIDKNDKYSSNDFIERHIREANPPNEKEFEYFLSSTGDERKIKNPLRFSGIAYDFHFGIRILKFKDCDYLDFDKIPESGYIFQNIRKEEEEKKRQQDAIRKVEFDETQNRNLINALFFPQNLEGHWIDTDIIEPVFQKTENGENFIYSPNQTKAIIQALECEPLSVIQGPPGTGKTTVITEIVFQILHREPNATVLITSQTNDAVDNVLNNLLKNEIPIVRLSGVRQPKGKLQKHTMERKIEGWKNEVRKKATKNWKTIERDFKNQLKNEIVISSIVNILLKNTNWKIQKSQIDKTVKLFKFKISADDLETRKTCIEALDKLTKIDLKGFFDKKELHENWLATISGLDEKSNLNQKLIKNIRVIGATTNHIAAGKYKKYGFEFDYVIMDESGKATISESLIPLTMGNKAILVGDHRQLRPMLTSNREVERWLRKNFNEDNQDFDSFDEYSNRPSLFEEVITRIDAGFSSQLEVCRRCSEDQVRLISECFYEPFGDEKIQYKARSQDKEHNLDLNVNSSIIFLDIGNTPDTKSKRRGKKGSSYNSFSAKLIPQILEGLDGFEQVRGYEIGVITGYTAQLKEINDNLRRKRGKWKNLKIDYKRDISVVDRFQGLEKDIIIFDLVRSQQNNLGFLANANRINVALSRQKKLLIIVGNYDWLLTAKSPKNNQPIALQRYLRKLKKDWIVKSVEQIF